MGCFYQQQGKSRALNDSARESERANKSAQSVTANCLRASNWQRASKEIGECNRIQLSKSINGENRNNGLQKADMDYTYQKTKISEK